MTISKKVIAMILGGGAGTRLYPLTATRSKPAVPIGGKYRLVDIPISNCINSNINRMYVLTQYNSASLNAHIKNSYPLSGFSKGFVDILAAEQTPDSPGWFQGTADAVRQSLKHIEKHAFEYVLILSGDQLYQMDFSHLLDIHENTNADITIATIPVGASEASEFGILKTNKEHTITSFIEKPKKEILPDWESDTGYQMKDQGRNFLASMGIYVFNRNILIDLLNNEYKNATDFGKQIIPNAINHYKVISYQYQGYWTDIGNIHSFFEANLSLTLDLPPFNLFDNDNVIYTRTRMLPPAKLSGSNIHQAIIADGCIIHAEIISNSVIGIRSRIGKRSKIVSCYIMGNDSYETIKDMNHNALNNIPKIGIGEDCELTNVIVDKDCRIGNRVIIKGHKRHENIDHPLFSIKEGIIVIKKGAILNDGFQLI